MVLSEVGGEVEDKMANRHLSKKAVQATWSKRKRCPLLGIRMFLSRMGAGEGGDGGETEARRTRGLDLRRREQLNVKMSAWPPRDYCLWALLRLVMQGFGRAGGQFAACL